jgi:glycosyltransferase involved in cell wall biosynthesis
MRILLICYDSPLNCSYGAGLRTNHIWHGLKGVGDVSTLVMEPSHITEVDRHQHEAEFARIRFKKPNVPWTTAETKQIRRLVNAALANTNFDLVVVRYLRLAMLIRPCITAPMIVDGDDLNKLETSLKKSLLNRGFDGLKTLARRAVTRREIRKFDHVWYVNPLDKQHFPAKSGSVLPNVTRMPQDVAPANRAPTATVLMVGKMSYEPNTEGADFFIREVLPALRQSVTGAKLRLVGQCTPELKARWGAVEGVEVVGFVDDLSAEYASAWMVVAPVFSGGGTQIKVLEALSYGCGVVVSEFSANGFAPQLLADEHMLVAKSPQEWLSHCLSLIHSAAKASALGKAGQKVIAETYSSESMARAIALTTRLHAGKQ